VTRSGLCRQALDGICRAVALEILDAVGADRQQGVVASLYELLLDQEPHREFKMLARSAGHLLEVTDEDSRLVGLDAPAGVKDLEDSQPRHLLDGKFILYIGSSTEDAPPILPLAVVDDVVPCSPIRIAEGVVRLGDDAETRFVAGFAVVRMELLRKQAVDPMNGFRLSAGTDLEVLVVVASLFLWHGRQPRQIIGRRTLEAAPPRLRKASQCVVTRKRNSPRGNISSSTCLAGVAQLVERLIRNQQVRGSSPRAGSKILNESAVSSARLNRIFGLTHYLTH
jgi:hypothetical protein